MTRQFPLAERGAALFAVLAMVMLLAGFAGLGLARLRAATDRISDAGARSEVQLLANAGTSAGLSIIPQLKARSSRRSDLLQVPIELPLGDGRVELRFSDGGNCFNLNSLSRPPATVSSGEVKPAATPQDFARLLAAAGIPAQEALPLARATAGRLGSSGVLWADGSEWTSVPGVTARYWQLAGGFLCALPNRDVTALNINSLKPEQAPLLAGMGLGAAEARQALARKPPGGWGSGEDFWQQASSTGTPEGGGAESIGTSSRWMEMRVTASTAHARVTRDLLIDTIRQPARVVSSRWRAVEVEA